MSVKIILDPLEVRSGARSFGGPQPSLDLEMLRLIARNAPIRSEELSEMIWPGLAARWRLARLSELRAQLKRRLQRSAIEPGENGWELAADCQVLESASQLSFEGLTPSQAELLEALSGGPMTTAELASLWGVSAGAVRKRVHAARQSLPQGAIMAGGGGYQLSALEATGSPGQH